MEDSPIKLGKWLAAMWLITNAKNGISSYEIHRAIGITQKSAWFMLHRIRLAFSDQPTSLSGTEESDETLIGGLEKNKHESKRVKAAGVTVGKAVVMGMLERGDADKHSKVRVKHINTATRHTLHGEITKYVQPGPNFTPTLGKPTKDYPPSMCMSLSITPLNMCLRMCIPTG